MEIRPGAALRLAYTGVRLTFLSASPLSAAEAQHRPPMSKQRMEQNWQRMMGQILSTWNALDEDALKKTRGNLSQLVALIHEQTGEDKQLILRKVSVFV